jgi:glutaredoxin
MKFTIYSKPGCPYCDKIKAVMYTYNFDHVVYTLSEDFTSQQFIDEFGPGTTFPQVIMNDQKLGGCVDTVKYLKENGHV